MNIFKECNFDKGEGHLLSTTNDSLNSSFTVIKLVRSFSTFQHLVHASLKKINKHRKPSAWLHNCSLTNQSPCHTLNRDR